MLWPETPAATVLADAPAAWAESRADAAEQGKLYIPAVTNAWDASPRCSRTDAYLEQWGYPWVKTWRTTPAEFAQELRLAKEYLDRQCAASTGPCPPLVINAWNEWSESSYLEPDERNGWGKLQAVRAVFGNTSAGDTAHAGVE